MSLHLRDRWLDWTLRVVGVLVIAALAYLAYTVWQGERQAKQGSLSSRAIDNLEQVVREQPENADARVLLGDAYRDMGSPADAIEQYDAALELQADHAGALSDSTQAVSPAGRPPTRRSAMGLRQPPASTPSAHKFFETMTTIQGCFREAPRSLKPNPSFHRTLRDKAAQRR